MLDIRPVFNVIGLLVLCIGLLMLVPLWVDLMRGNDHWSAFLQSSLLTVFSGTVLFLATQNKTQRDSGLSLKQTFLLTTGIWVSLPIFGALPFVLGQTSASITDAFFEAMSGLTTTGATVFSDLERLPDSLLLWRGILQWLGGIGIIIVAMMFLPELRVGGMQVFRTSGFDAQGKVLPRATQMASYILVLYIVLTALCALCYLIAGMRSVDAAVHAMTTIATGGFSTRDASFADFGPMVQYLAVVFMCMASLPFLRYVQLASGTVRPIFKDSQIAVFFVIIITFALIVFLWMLRTSDLGVEDTFRMALFNSVSILTGTGYASADYNAWGGFAVVLFLYAGLIGGCAGSTSCSVKVFRYQLLFAAAKAQVQRIYTPSGVFPLRYQGRKVTPDVLDSVLTFFVVFFATLGVVAVLLSLSGLDLITALSGAAAALANIGPGLGDIIGPTGNYAPLNAMAKWILIMTMLIGRLELMAIYVLFTVKFWRN